MLPKILQGSDIEAVLKRYQQLLHKITVAEEELELKLSNRQIDYELELELKKLNDMLHECKLQYIKTIED